VEGLMTNIEGHSRGVVGHLPLGASSTTKEIVAEGMLVLAGTRMVDLGSGPTLTRLRAGVVRRMRGRIIRLMGGELRKVQRGMCGGRMQPTIIETKMKENHGMATLPTKMNESPRRGVKTRETAV